MKQATKLCDIFLPNSHIWEYRERDLYLLGVSEGFIRKMDECLQLEYAAGNRKEHNLCFAKSRGLRPEFRTVFTNSDVVKYVTHLLRKDSYELSFDKVPFPDSDVEFWEGVEAVADNK